ncbi:MAG TPA: DNA repair protein RecN [Flexilinea sp.]|nr:DNA repair protein RecN [Flexilinea sp.]HPB39595.1 DNA repair protein RecN [Flexilinea sp.]HPL57371.1 DNA repair protein RecN [Flexilinea sp.]HQJ00851.1 DNA repair protein RecN [Flexilinea sp.]
MLTELYIRNFAIIDELELSLKEGLNIFTGETGAGKSIILDAVSTVVGGKTDPTFIREGTDRAIVEAVFRPDENREAIREILKREDLPEDSDGDQIILSRDIRAGGRSSARVNGSSVNVNLLREIGRLLVDIHGQSDHLSLLNPSNHIVLLDRFAGNQELLKKYQAEFKKLQKIRTRLTEIRMNDEELLRKKDMLSFQMNEIRSAKINESEEETLKKDRDRLANAENLSQLTQKAMEQLEGRSEEYPGIFELLGYLSKSMDNLSRIDAELAPLGEEVAAINDALNELLASLQRYQETLEFNPARLDAIEERLALLNTLKRKYGGSLRAVLEFAARAEEQLAGLENISDQTEDLIRQETSVINLLSELAQELSDRRHEASRKVSESVEKELHELRMESAQFEIRFTQTAAENGLRDRHGRSLAYDENGFDQVEFLIAPNPGEGLKPLAKIASGGETSRLMLALKNTLAEADSIPSMIFDEIDQGIGGRVGSIVGEKLWLLSRNHQILCITHLPQLAAYYDAHFHVSKQLSDGRTRTLVKQLQPEESLREMAQLMGGDSPENRRASGAMILNAQKWKESVK